MKKIILIFFLLGKFVSLFAQERPLDGIVFDRDSKQRLPRVYIYNLRTHKGFYNNSKGEFNFKVAKGDTLVAALSGYRVDTVTIHSQTTVLFYLKRLSILLRQVTINDTIKNPAARNKANQEAYEAALKRGHPADLLSIGGGNNVGVGLSIDALWSLLSREGKNARYLQKILERDYRDMMIDYRFSKSTVSSATGLAGAALDDFMSQYRPSYYFVLNSNDYALIAFIKSSYQQYQKNPSANRLPPLKGE